MVLFQQSQFGQTREEKPMAGPYHYEHRREYADPHCVVLTQTSEMIIGHATEKRARDHAAALNGLTQSGNAQPVALEIKEESRAA